MSHNISMPIAKSAFKSDLRDAGLLLAAQGGTCPRAGDDWPLNVKLNQQEYPPIEPPKPPAAGKQARHAIVLSTMRSAARRAPSDILGSSRASATSVGKLDIHDPRSRLQRDVFLSRVGQGGPRCIMNSMTCHLSRPRLSVGGAGLWPIIRAPTILRVPPYLTSSPPQRSPVLSICFASP